MSKASQLAWTLRLANLFTSTVIRAGVKMGNMSLLTVRGRRSGLPRTTPVAVGEYNGQRYLVGTINSAQWVSNLRVAGTATLTRARRSEVVTAVELPPEEAALILKYSLGRAPGFVRRNFAVTATSPLKDLEREALQHPVFLLERLID